MRIFLIVPGGVDKSGRQRVIPALLCLIERLVQIHEVVVIALRQYEQPCQYTLYGAQIINLGASAGKMRIQRLAQYVQSISKLAVQYGHPDVIHAFGANDCGLLGGIAGRWWRVPMILSIIGGELTWLPQIGYGGQGSWANRMRVTWALRAANIVTGGSRHVCNQMQTHNPVWLPLGVDTNRFTARVSGLAGPPWQLIQVATINKVKDQTTLLQAFARLRTYWPDIHLHLIGLDILNGRLEQLTQQLSLSDAVTFHGFLTQDDLLPLYQRAHLYIQSSLHESQGVAVLEAAACGVPTVGTEVGLVAEMAPEAAIAVPVNEPADLAQAILGLLLDPARREQLGQAAQTWAQTYNADWTATRFSQLYQQMTTQ